MAETFDGDWLALREPFDAASRSQALAERLCAALPARPRLVDLGAGTGSLFRWLAPIIARPQLWTLADADSVLLRRAFQDIADWAAARGLATSRAGSAANPALLVHTRLGAWRVQAVLCDLAGPPDRLPLAGTDAVVCSALLDLVSTEWIARFVRVLRRPLLACLNVDGRDAVLPADPLDRVVAAGFRRDQGRDKGFGPALGPRAATVLESALRARGFTVHGARSDWRIPPRAADMLDALVAGQAGAAAQQIPDRRTAIRAWAARRAHLVDGSRLAMRIGHRDSLALPAEKGPGKMGG